MTCNQAALGCGDRIILGERLFIGRMVGSALGASGTSVFVITKRKSSDISSCFLGGDGSP